METPFPLVSQALIDALDRLYPDRCPDPDLLTPDIYFKSGQASVVRKLKAEFKRQNTQE